MRQEQHIGLGQLVLADPPDLAITAIIWGTSAGALRQSPHEHLTMKEIAADWSMAEGGAAPDWSIAPAQACMW
jgi:hypothetical protein